MLRGKYHSQEDQLLLSQIKEGSRAAFDVLYGKYKVDIFEEAYKRLQDLDLAKDITQDVFTALWIRAGEAQIENLPGYLYTAVKNNVYRLMQRQDKFVPMSDLLYELDNNANRADANILYQELLKAYEELVASLPDQQRIIYQMRYNENMTPEEIAEKLNLSPKTVRNHLGRALLKLRPSLVLIQLLFMLAGKHQ